MLTEEQLNNRKNGIGATDSAIILGISPYKTKYQLWLEKTGRVEPQPILNDSRVRLRHAHEQTIADEYESQFNVKLKTVDQTIYHSKLPFMLCHLDRVVVGQDKIIECKSSNGFMRSKWGLSGSDEAPLHYIVQVQHQLACTGFDDADIAALIDIDDYRVYPIKRNQNIINKIELECEIFWNFNVLQDIQPDPLTRDDLNHYYSTNNGDFIECDDHAMSLIKELNFLKNESKNLDSKKTLVENEIIKLIGFTDGIKEGDSTIATFKANKNGSRVLRIREGVLA